MSVMRPAIDGFRPGPTPAWSTRRISPDHCLPIAGRAQVGSRDRRPERADGPLRNRHPAPRTRGEEVGPVGEDTAGTVAARSPCERAEYGAALRRSRLALGDFRPAGAAARARRSRPKTTPAAGLERRSSQLAGPRMARLQEASEAVESTVRSASYFSSFPSNSRGPRRGARRDLTIPKPRRSRRRTRSLSRDRRAAVLRGRLRECAASRHAEDVIGVGRPSRGLAVGAETVPAEAPRGGAHRRQCVRGGRPTGPVEGAEGPMVPRPALRRRGSRPDET